jgi:hypothetical protein
MLYVESKSVNGIYQMSEAEREVGGDGLNQIRNGQWITHEESNKRADEWLRKRINNP